MTSRVPSKTDPSSIIQHFPKFDFRLLCCRLWQVTNWEFNELSFPYWRIYHNNREGATIFYKNNEINLRPECIYLIAPHTSYATRLFNNAIPSEGYLFKGKRVDSEKELTYSLPSLQHLFIHFSIGMLYDSFGIDVMEIKLNSFLNEKLAVIRKQVIKNVRSFGFHSFLALQAVINYALSEVKEENWKLISKDYRIISLINFIENNLQSDLSNNTLAIKCNLTVNAFIRFFTNEIGLPPQHYVRNKRIDKACLLLLHSNFSIEKIAALTGFSNRYHFSRVFKSLNNSGPAGYRKDFTYEEIESNKAHLLKNNNYELE